MQGILGDVILGMFGCTDRYITYTALPMRADALQAGDAIWMSPYVIQWYAALGTTRTR